jgi:hypothetical protein
MQVSEKKPAPARLSSVKGSGREDFFIWICCNPLKRPNPAKGIQGNPSLFPWFYLDLLAFISLGRGRADWPEVRTALR